jgi:hypothetical protein
MGLLLSLRTQKAQNQEHDHVQCEPESGSARTFAQVRGFTPEVCKTVGSAYVGSNPTPATRFRRSEPVTLDCVTGFWRERERFIRPSAVVRGLCVGQIRLSAAAAHGAG